MSHLAILATLDARPGKEKEVEEFLKSAQPLALRETGTVEWFAVKLGPSRFAVFDTFADAAGRDAHLSGDIARALLAKAEELFSSPPRIEQATILAEKTSRS